MRKPARVYCEYGGVSAYDFFLAIGRISALLISGLASVSLAQHDVSAIESGSVAFGTGLREATPEEVEALAPYR